MEPADIFSLFDVKKLQQLQDEFSDVTGVASWITDVNGEPILTPSRMSRLCREYIQVKGQGKNMCFMMNKHLVLNKQNTISIDFCPVTGLWEAGIGIFLDNVHIASWMIGQVRIPGDNPQQLETIAKEFGFDPDEIKNAYLEIPAMSREQFQRIASMLQVFVNMLIDNAKKSQELHRSNKELEDAIERAEQNEYRFKALHNASFGGIAIHDKGLILDCNEGLSKITGYSHDELVGMDGFRLIAKESRQMVETNIVDQYEKPYEAKGVRKDGTIYPLRLEGRMIPYKGKTVRVVEFRDITERNRIIQELVNAKEKAIQSDRLKSAFLTNMSHEIRTPMNGILGFIDILNTPGLTDNERMEFTATIQKSSNRLLDTINDIITFSQIEAGDVTITEEEIELREVLKSHSRFFAPEINEKGLEMIIENYLPEDKSRILTDKVKLDSILTNLIKNAIKFTNSGQIIVGVREKDGKLEYFVKDTGIGIPKDKHELIFDRFMQADMGISRGHEGSGLGLAICRGYVNNLGGKIWVESEENRGSTFKFTTKYKKAEPHKIIEESSFLKDDMLDMKQKSDVPVMLIAEDDETSYELLLMILGKGNYRFLYAANGVEAVDIYMNNPGIDIILMDLKMPEMDGLEATRRIREMDKQIPIIAQTAFAFDADIKTAYEAGCTDYVTKPIRRHEILEKIDNCLKE